MHSLNVLHLCTSDVSSGASIASIDLHRSLIKKGVLSNYLVLNLRNSHSQDACFSDHRKIYKTYWEKFRYLYLTSWWIETKTRWILKDIQTNEMVSLPYSCFDITKDPLYERADVIHIHWTAGFLDWPSFFKKNKKPIVWTLHDKNPFSGILHCSSDLSMINKKLEERVLLKKKSYLQDSIIHIVSPSIKLFKISRSSRLLSEFPHSYFPHGVMKFFFHPLDKINCRNELQLPLKKKIILAVVSDISRKLKGFNELTEFAERNPQYHYIFIGKEHAGMPHGTNITYTGFIRDRTVMNDYYNAADITVSNSVEESFGLIVAESLMTGTPVLSRDTGMSKEVIVDKVNGFIIEEKVSDTIDQAMSVEWDAKLVLQSIEGFFDMDSCVQRHYDLYQELVSKRNF